jgi:monovalent cation:H+ antiporter-2, CPA2 family
VVLLRGLMDNSLLNTSHGQAAIGWLVMEDILSVLILVLMPTLAANSGQFDWQNLALTLLKAAAFVAIMFFAGVRLIPWLLEKVAHTHSRELFILATLAVTLGTAMAASEIFGVSLALGAFVAGAIISQSHLSHQVGADVFSFREAFSVLFFVSVGMLVNPLFFWNNLGQVLALTTLVVLGKAVIVIALGLLLPRPAKTFLIVAVGLSQIGEFSFILGQGGLYLKLLNADQYSLILAAALLSITLNPFMYKLLPGLEKTFRKIPFFWRQLEANKALPEIDLHKLVNHVVIIGYDRAGKHLVDALEALSIPILVIEADAEKITLLNQRNIPTLYGDAGNSEVITHANLEQARALVTTVPDETTTLMIVTAARDLNKDLPIIARAGTEEGVRYLAESGASHIVQPELEGGLELIHHTLLSLEFPLREVHQYVEAIRQDNYDPNNTTEAEHRSLHELLRFFKEIEVIWLDLMETSSLVGKSLEEANIRAKSGASVVALIRDKQLIANPKSVTVFASGDRIGVIGDKEQISVVRELIQV